MSSKPIIGSIYYNTLDSLMRLAAEGEIIPEILEQPDKKSCCYFCLNGIENDVLILEKSGVNKNIEIISHYRFHKECYDAARKCYEKKIPYILIREPLNEFEIECN